MRNPGRLRWSAQLFFLGRELSGQALLQSLADLDQDGLQSVTPAVLDFATAMKVDVQTAMSLVGKTIGSSTNALTRYGIEIDTSGTKAEKLAQVTQALTDKFGGMAEAAADTATGSLTQLSNTMGDLKEAYGRSIAEGIQPFVEGLKNVVTQMVEAANRALDLREALDLQAEGQSTSAQQTLLILENQRDKLGQIAAAYEGLDEEANTAWENAKRNVIAYNESLDITDIFLSKAATTEERRKSAIDANTEAIAEYAQILLDARTEEEARLDVLQIEIEKLVLAKAAAKEYGEEWAGIETLLVTLLNEKNELLTDGNELLKEGTEIIQFQTGIVEEWRLATIAAILEVADAEKKANDEAIAAAEEKKNAQLSVFSELASAMSSFSDLVVLGNKNEIISIDAKIKAAEKAGESTKEVE